MEKLEQRVVSGRYDLISTVGRGGTGTVYLARDRHLSCFVAVKAVPKENLPGVEALERELRILLPLRHPRIPQVLDFFEEGECWYLTMTFVPGRSPEQIREEGEERMVGTREPGKQEAQAEERRRNAPRRDMLPWNVQVIEWGRQICGILSYLHHLDPPVVYGDLKPSNLRIDDGGTLCLTDFGSAVRLRRDGTGDFPASGTVGYAAPEQYEGEEGQPGTFSDIYSWGATMEALLRGHRKSLFLRWILWRCCRMKPGMRFASVDNLRKMLFFCPEMRKFCGIHGEKRIYRLDGHRI